MSKPITYTNIGPKEIRKRYMNGWIMLGLSIFIMIVLFYTEIERWWRFGLFLPLLLSAYGFFQAHGKT